MERAVDEGTTGLAVVEDAEEWGAGWDDGRPETDHEGAPLQTVKDLLEPYVTPVRLDLPLNLKYDQWESWGTLIQLTEKASRWWLGDWLVYGERAYGEDYAQAAEETGLKEHTLATIRWVSNSIPPAMRIEKLDWYHHRLVAGLENPADQRYWLQRAADEEMSTRMLEQKIREWRAAQEDSSDKQDEPEQTSMDDDWDPLTLEVEALANMVRDARNPEHQNHGVYLASREDWPGLWGQIDRVITYLEKSRE